MEPAKADREYPLGEIIIKTGKESQEDMADTRTDELYRALQDKGYPDELCREIAYKHMNYRLHSYTDAGVFIQGDKSQSGGCDR